MMHLSSQIPEREFLLESEGHALSAGSVETHNDEDKENQKYTNSTSYRENKSAFSSLVGLTPIRCLTWCDSISLGSRLKKNKIALF